MMYAKTVLIAGIFVFNAAFAPSTLAHISDGRSSFDLRQVGKNREPKDPVSTPTDGGIREEFPEKYRERFDQWKMELISTEFGRDLWDRFAGDRDFILRIVISRNEGTGAWAGRYKRDLSGRLVEATVMLGDDLDSGYPAPVYYPVLNSLKRAQVDGSVLAAAKMAHELGHVSYAADQDSGIAQLRERLSVLYNARLMKVGFNDQDNFLNFLAKQMGGTPGQISEEKEYASEVYTYRYIESRIGGTKRFCRVARQVHRNLESDGPKYGSYFEPHLMRSSCFN
jgi:hypothetical protein